ncbi:MAG: YCF48-related protein [Candidatus Methylumidiphilus sp.]
MATSITPRKRLGFLTKLNRAGSGKNKLNFRKTKKNWLLISLALVIFLATSWLAFEQNVRLSAWQIPGDLFSQDGWRYPIERNPTLRAPRLSARLHDIFVLPGTGKLWVVGNDGLIIHSEDGGRHWQNQDGHTDRHLTSVFFVNDQDGWVVGGEGEILVTHDGGKYWQAQPGATKENLFGVHFIDKQNGWAVGWRGAIITTRDSGQNWNSQTSDVKVGLTGIHFLGSLSRPSKRLFP